MGKFTVIGAVTLGVVAMGQAAFAADAIVITPGKASDKAVTYQSAAPTRLFDVEKATTLAPGENRFGANLQVGGLGSGATAGIAGGVNLRADMNVSPGFETGISVTGLGGAGTSNLLGNLALRGKLALTEFSVGATPIEVGGMASVGAFATGGGIGSANIGVGIPMTAAISNNVNVTLVPGLGFGFAAGGLLPGGAQPAVGGAGLTPGLGLGLDIGLTRNLSALIDGNLGAVGTGLSTAGTVGLRYGISDDFAIDLSAGYKGSPLSAVNAGTVGLGGYYAF